MMFRKSFILAGAALFVSSMAAAQGAPQRPNIDANGDNVISRDEAVNAATQRFARMDANRDGRLDQADWTQIRTQRRAEMFQRLDRDNNGSITRAEWDQAADERAARMSERMAQRGERGERMGRRHGGGRHGGRGMIARVDTNRDSVITREEFMAAVTERHARLDSNGDGNVTAEERQAQRSARRDRAQ
jgi:Ca2+-binding EF-hand superfamily protein